MPTIVNSSQFIVHSFIRSMNRELKTVNSRFWRHGFTTIELVVAMAIVVILASASYIVWWQNIPKRSRDSQRIADISAIRVALESYYEKWYSYPARTLPLYSQTIFTSNTIPPGATDWIPDVVPIYISQLPKDPKTEQNYLYYVAPDHKSYQVWAILENQKDSRIYTHPEAKCKETPAPEVQALGLGYNFCGDF